MTNKSIALARSVVADVLNVPLENVDDQTSFWTVDSWDSLRHVALLAQLETVFGKQLADNEAEDIVDFPTICRVFCDQQGTIDDEVSQTGAISPSLIEKQLDALQLPADAVLLLHSSYKAIGNIAGGPKAFLTSLLKRIEAVNGTLVVPAFSSRHSEHAYDPARSTTEGVGLIPEIFRRLDGTVRSDHPISSVAAWGSHADYIVASHPLDCPEGPDGPFGRMYAKGARVLLVGVDHESNSSVHLAEYLENVPYQFAQPLSPDKNSPLSGTFIGIRHCEKASFQAVDIELSKMSLVTHFRLGDAEAEFMAMEDVVRVARGLLAEDPLRFLCGLQNCEICTEMRYG